MTFNPLAFMEPFVVLAFVIGWLVLEAVSRRYDMKRNRELRGHEVGSGHKKPRETRKNNEDPKV